MSFQMKMYAVFWVSLLMISAAIIMAMLNGRAVEGASYWLIIAALPIFATGLPAFINKHTGILYTEESVSKEEANKEDE